MCSLPLSYPHNLRSLEPPDQETWTAHVDVVWARPVLPNGAHLNKCEAPKQKARETIEAFRGLQRLIVHDGRECQTMRNYCNRRDELTSPRHKPSIRTIGAFLLPLYFITDVNRPCITMASPFTFFAWRTHFRLLQGSEQRTAM